MLEPFWENRNGATVLNIRCRMFMFTFTSYGHILEFHKKKIEGYHDKQKTARKGKISKSMAINHDMQRRNWNMRNDFLIQLQGTALGKKSFWPVQFMEWNYRFHAAIAKNENSWKNKGTTTQNTKTRTNKKKRPLQVSKISGSILNLKICPTKKKCFNQNIQLLFIVLCCLLICIFFIWKSICMYPLIWIVDKQAQKVKKLYKSKYWLF